MKLLSELRAANRGRDMQALLEAIPYARFLGMRVEIEDTVLTTILPFRDELVGNHLIGALHGGVIAAFAELTAAVELVFTTECARLPKTVDFNIDYLRSGRGRTTFGRAFITKHGRRVANVRVELWQHGSDEALEQTPCADREASRLAPWSGESGRAIASAHGHFLLAPIR